jgi:hypothetical protein
VHSEDIFNPVPEINLETSCEHLYRESDRQIYCQILLLRGLTKIVFRLWRRNASAYYGMSDVKNGLVVQQLCTARRGYT